MSVIHIARAVVMARMGHDGEARFYLRRFALATFRHYRSQAAHAYRDGARHSAAALHANDLLGEASAYMLASRRFRGGPIALADIDTTGFWEPCNNPHWPALGSHGVFAKVHECHGKKRSFVVEIQILPPDAKRSQFCPTRGCESRADAERWARQMVTVGRAVVAATVEMNRPVKRSPAVQQELALEGAR